jgi:hypothetical protein
MSRPKGGVHRRVIGIRRPTASRTLEQRAVDPSPGSAEEVSYTGRATDRTRRQRLPPRSTSEYRRFDCETTPNDRWSTSFGLGKRGIRPVIHLDSTLQREHSTSRLRQFTSCTVTLDWSSMVVHLVKRGGRLVIRDISTLASAWMTGRSWLLNSSTGANDWSDGTIHLVRCRSRLVVHADSTLQLSFPTGRTW